MVMSCLVNKCETAYFDSYYMRSQHAGISDSNKYRYRRVVLLLEQVLSEPEEEKKMPKSRHFVELLNKR